MRKKGSRLSKKQIKIIKRYNLLGYNDGDIAVKMYMSKSTVRRYRIKLKLPVRNAHTFRTEIRRIRRFKIRYKREVKKLGGYRKVVNISRVAQLGWLELDFTQACILHVLIEGFLSTPEIIKKVIDLRISKEWKPITLSKSRFYSCIYPLVQQGFVKSIRNNKRIGESNIYELTSKAKNELKKRHKSTGYHQLHEKISNNKSRW